MKLFENYNTAKQKYGDKIVRELSDIGIPPQYLLSACRFYQDSQVPIERLQQLFRQWLTYVDNGDETIDVNKLSFEEFYNTIQKSKSLYEIPNKIFDNGTIKIGEFRSFKEANMFPVPNNMCICKTKKWFKYYQSPHSRYLLIYDSRRNDDKRYVLAIIEYGDISYADLSGHEFANSFADQEKGNATQTEFDQYQQSIGKEAVAFLYNIAADVKDKIDNNNDIKTEQYMRRNTIRLTESRLRGMIQEAVKGVLNEMEGNELNFRGDMPDYGTISLSDLQKALKMAWFDDLEKIESREMLFGLDDELRNRVEDILSKYRELCEECRRLAYQIERMPDYQFSGDYIFNDEA